MEKMYRQIWVHPEDQKYQSILWREDANKAVQILHLTTVTYGLACSAFLASRTLKQLAKDHESDYPLGSHALNQELYMDDLLSGAHSLNEALIKQKNIIDILQVGGFPIRKWSANHLSLLEWLPPELVALDPIDFRDPNATVSILGLSWLPQNDCLKFAIDASPIVGTITKRLVLSNIARIFDPVGWIAPAVITAKILLQSMWLLKIGWDDPLPDNLVSQWLLWQNDLPHLKEIAIPAGITSANQPTS